MKPVCLALALFFIPLLANGKGGRAFDLYAGAGVVRMVSKLTENNLESSFAGWAPEAEVGMDLPFNPKLGMTGSLYAGRGEVFNSIGDNSYLERGSVDYRGAKLGFYWTYFSLAGSMRDSRYKVDSVPTSNSGSERVVKGMTTAYHAAFSFDFKGQLRTAIEGSFQNGKLGSVSADEYTIGIKIYFLFHP